MPVCTRCHGTREQWHEEDGRQVRDVCYHCAGTGEISNEQLKADRVVAMAEALAYAVVQQWKDNANSDPDGEGWGFAAAENGLSEYDYTSGQIAIESDRILKWFDQRPEVVDQIGRLWLDSESLRHRSNPSSDNP